MLTVWLTVSVLQPWLGEVWHGIGQGLTSFASVYFSLCFSLFVVVLICFLFLFLAEAC